MNHGFSKITCDLRPMVWTSVQLSILQLPAEVNDSYPGMLPQSNGHSDQLFFSTVKRRHSSRDVNKKCSLARDTNTVDVELHKFDNIKWWCIEAYPRFLFASKVKHNSVLFRKITREIPALTQKSCAKWRLAVLLVKLLYFQLQFVALLHFLCEQVCADERFARANQPNSLCGGKKRRQTRLTSTNIRDTGTEGRRLPYKTRRSDSEKISLYLLCIYVWIFLFDCIEIFLLYLSNDVLPSLCWRLFVSNAEEKQITDASS